MLLPEKNNTYRKKKEKKRKSCSDDKFKLWIKDVYLKFFWLKIKYFNTSMMKL